MLTFPNAKINIGLHITRKRPDGYHDLETVFYPVSIHDALELHDARETSFRAAGNTIPGDASDNLCLKAFRLLAADHLLTPQQFILLKHIPIGAGLGGGSSDAAFTLKMLNERFKLALSDEMLERYARKLGADCAFFVKNKPVYAFGKGDEFEPLHVDLSAYQIIVVKPGIHISTQQAYSGVLPRPAGFDLRELPGVPVSRWKDNVVNDFELSIFDKYPEIARLKSRLYGEGAIFAQMSGSGSAVYGIFERSVTPDLSPGYQVFYSR